MYTRKMSFNSVRVNVQYLIYGIGLLIAFVGCAINSNKHLLTFGVGLDIRFLFLLVTITVGNTFFLYYLLKLEEKWELKLSKKHVFWKMRPNADCGIWLTSLFPLTLLTSSFVHFQALTPIYLVTTALTLGCFVSSLIFLSKGVQQNMPNIKMYIVLQLPFSAVISVYLHYSPDILLSYWYGYPMVIFVQILFLILVVKLLFNCPFVFTIGEVLAVSQITIALILACFLWLLQINFKFFCISGTECDYGNEVTQFLQVLALGSAFITVVVSTNRALFQKIVPFYSLCFITACLTVYPAWFLILKTEPFLWLVYFCFNSFHRALLIGHWVSCVFVAVCIVAWRNFYGLQATTTVRKYFHAVIVLIYFPGFLYDQEMLFLASGVVLFLFFVFEMIRTLKMAPFGHSLDSMLRIFLDEKDAGNLILSHIYLLVGFSLPLWILPVESGFCLATLSGLLALGFGDTAASVGGTMWGLHKLPDSKKSVEGTLCAIVVQLFVTILISLYVDLSLSALEVMHVFLATIVCCGMEAFTNQVDNLVLPIFLYLMLVPL